MTCSIKVAATTAKDAVARVGGVAFAVFLEVGRFRVHGIADASAIENYKQVLAFDYENELAQNVLK